MSSCCGSGNTPLHPTDPCYSSSPSSSPTGSQTIHHPAANWFENMISNCLAYTRQAKNNGRPIVGILCEYTPRELFLAAGAVPVSLCGGSQETISAAETHLPANLCPLIKSTYGYHVMKSNPFLDMADWIVAETTCDGKKKMYELLAQSRPVYVLELPQKPNDSDAFLHWHREIVKLKEELERRFSVQITPEKLQSAIHTMNRERSLRKELAELMQQNTPPLAGRQILLLKSSISGMDEVLENYEQILDFLKKQKLPKSQSSPIRVMLTGVPVVHGAERIVDLIESLGGLVVCQENCTGIKPLMENIDTSCPDLLHAIAEKYFHLPCSVMTPNPGRLDFLRQLAKTFRPDCVMELTWQCCLTYDIESFHVKELCRNQLNLPYLHIQTDYSPADSARIAVRVEALFEKIRSFASSKESTKPCSCK